MSQQLAIGSTVCSCFPLPMKSIVIGPFVFQKTISMTVFPDTVPRTFLYWRVNVSTSWTVFSTHLVVSNLCLANSERFFKNKTCFFIHIKRSSVNFTWFVFLKQQKFDDRLLFKSGAFWFSTIWNNFQTNIFARLKWFLLWFQVMQNL